jgi:hypothetical protein
MQRSLIAGLLLALSATGVLAQAGQAGRPPQAAPKQDKASPVKTTNAEQIIYLIRTTLLTLNDANRSGNYSVLRDLAAPSFQAKNSPADLAVIFADLRQRKFDLFAAAIAAPQLMAAPQIDATGHLRLIGYLPTQPLRIEFDLVFETVDKQWRLVGIGVATPPAQVAQAQQTPPLKPAISTAPPQARVASAAPIYPPVLLPMRQ